MYVLYQNLIKKSCSYFNNRKKIKNNDSQDTDNHLNGSQDIEPKKVRLRKNRNIKSYINNNKKIYNCKNNNVAEIS